MDNKKFMYMKDNNNNNVFKKIRLYGPDSIAFRPTCHAAAAECCSVPVCPARLVIFHSRFHIYVVNARVNSTEQITTLNLICLYFIFISFYKINLIRRKDMRDKKIYFERRKFGPKNVSGTTIGNVMPK